MKLNKAKLAAIFAELLGTFALAAVTLAISKTYGTPIFTTIAAAATFAGLYAVLGPVSGGHFNPAVTIGLLSVRRVTLPRAIVYVIVQAIGAVLAWKLFEWLSPERPITLSSITEFNYQIFFAEAIGTAVFALGYAGALYRKLQGGYAAAAVSLGLFAGSLGMAVVIVGRSIATGVLNPAVAITLGYRPQNQGYLAYFFGPVIGAIVGMNLYRFFFADQVAVAKVAAFKAEPVVETKVVAASVKPSVEKTVTKKKAAPKKKAAAKKTSKK